MLLTIAFNHEHPERKIQIVKLLYFSKQPVCLAPANTKGMTGYVNKIIFVRERKKHL